MPETKLELLRRRVTEVETGLDEANKRVTQLEKAIVGMIIPYGGAKEPQGSGWLFCDGRALSMADYPELHAVIGTNFGAGTTDENGKEITGKDFNLPDLRGRFVRGVNDGTKRDPDAKTREAQKPGGNAGDEVGSVQEDALKKHNHPYKTNIWFEKEKLGGKTYFGGTGTDGGLHGDDTDLSEGTKETRPKNIYVNWIIYAGRVK
jgi:microcystin-dependent protein